MTQARQHPLRIQLHNEIHARPPEALTVSLSISHLVMVCSFEERQASLQHLAQLARDHHLPQPDAQSTHVRLDLGSYRLRWSLHSEFVSWTFFRSIEADKFDDRNPETACDVVPGQWKTQLPGKCLTALNMWVLPAKQFDSGVLVKSMLNEETLVASTVVDGFGEVYTDFAVHADSFSRMLLLAGGMAPRRLGRVVQRLLEIETYRMVALLGLPVAREAAPELASAERELAELADAIRTATRSDEPVLLDRLTRLAGQVESQYAATHSRFSASEAYFDLVDKRIQDIGESRLAGLQTLREFMDRRLSPARSTCEWARRRQDALSARVERISSLLRTRVEIEQQQSSQDLLSAMNVRQGLQLKMQSTVEGLSVAAITYYIVGLVSYVAKGVQHLGWPLSPEVSAAVAIPLVAGGVWWSLQRLHRKIFREHP